MTAATAMVAVSPVPPAGASSDPAADARAVAQQIVAAQDRANAAADAWAAAESRLDVLNEDIDALTGQIADTEARVSALRDAARQLALRRYTSGDGHQLALFVDTDDLATKVQARVLAELATQGSNDAIDAYAAARDDLDAKQRLLQRKKDETQKASDALVAAKARLDEQIVSLRQLEQDKLRDAAVAKALAEERTRRAAAEQAHTREAAAGRGDSPVVAVKPATPNAGAPAVGASWQCPLPGAPFADTFGAPRSGGRRHEGTDMFAPAGTPVLAVVAGSAAPQQNELGGNAIWLSGSDGNTYYYAHLSAFGSTGSVAAGATVGYVGATGNANGVNHLHFEFHPGGGAAVNPYSILRAHC